MNDRDIQIPDGSEFAKPATRSTEIIPDESQRIMNTLLRVLDVDDVYKFTQQQIATAYYELDQLGISEEELQARRKEGKTVKELAEMVINGEFKKADPFNPGDLVKVRRTNGVIEKGWTIVSIGNDDKGERVARAQRPKDETHVYSRTISLDELKELNS
jgi:hypothetical protein